MLRIYTIDTCHLCSELKKRLSDESIPYTELNLKIKGNSEEFSKLYSVTKSDKVPVCIINKKILLPDRSFRSIDECIKLIKENT